eukprot:3216799-Rhodomonas_salina.3
MLDYIYVSFGEVMQPAVEEQRGYQPLFLFFYALFCSLWLDCVVVAGLFIVVVLVDFWWSRCAMSGTYAGYFATRTGAEALVMPFHITFLVSSPAYATATRSPILILAHATSSPSTDFAYPLRAFQYRSGP